MFVSSQFSGAEGAMAVHPEEVNLRDSLFHSVPQMDFGFCFFGPLKDFVFVSSVPQTDFVFCLHSRIKAEKENEEPKTIPLRVYGKGLNTFAVVSFSLWSSLHRVFFVTLVVVVVVFFNLCIFFIQLDEDACGQQLRSDQWGDPFGPAAVWHHSKKWKKKGFKSELNLSLFIPLQGFSLWPNNKQLVESGLSAKYLMNQWDLFIFV